MIKKGISSKRPEENYKFVFKKTLKALKNQFKKTQPKMPKKQLDELFYQKYFGEVSAKESIPLEHFHHPKNRKTTLKNFAVPKTINSYYIRNIMLSKNFMTQFRNYSENVLFLDYSKIMDSKFTMLISRWEHCISLSQDKSVTLGEIQKRILKNKKCKLPWNKREIDRAMKNVKNLFADVDSY